MKRLLLISFLAPLLISCGGKTKIDQSDICIYSTDAEAKQCESGKLAWFKPQRWGNEQLPLNVAAVYCDFNHEIMYNNAGVICVFTNKRLSLLD